VLEASSQIETRNRARLVANMSSSTKIDEYDEAGRLMGTYVESGGRKRGEGGESRVDFIVSLLPDLSYWSGLICERTPTLSRCFAWITGLTLRRVYGERIGPKNSSQHPRICRELLGCIEPGEYITDQKTRQVPENPKKWYQTWILDVFLPAGYPQSVTEDYLWYVCIGSTGQTQSRRLPRGSKAYRSAYRYQVYDSLQAFASSIAGMLSNRAVLEGRHPPLHHPDPRC
jgi:hypothetical protein